MSHDFLDGARLRGIGRGETAATDPRVFGDSNVRSSRTGF